MVTRTVSRNSVYEWTCDGCGKTVEFISGDQPEGWLHGSLSPANSALGHLVLACSRPCFDKATGAEPAA